MPNKPPATDQQRLEQIARRVRQRGVQAVAQALAEALQGGDLDDLERLTCSPITGKPSACLPGGVAVYGLPGLQVSDGTVRLMVRTQ